jgi:hypothetical protein
MNNELKETIQIFLTTYEQANKLPILRPMSHIECISFLNIAVDILTHLNKNEELKAIIGENKC